MNKSLSHITGDYVIFMNSGDMFYDDHVLEDIAPKLVSDIVYGNAYKRRNDGDYTETHKGAHFERMKMMLYWAFFCHQAQFTKTEIMRRYGFREEHRTTTDYDFLVRALAGKRSFGHVDRIICSFDENDGISAQKSNYLQMIKEDAQVYGNASHFNISILHHQVPQGPVSDTLQKRIPGLAPL